MGDPPDSPPLEHLGRVNESQAGNSPPREVERGRRRHVVGPPAVFEEEPVQAVLANDAGGLDFQRRFFVERPGLGGEDRADFLPVDQIVRYRRGHADAVMAEALLETGDPVDREGSVVELEHMRVTAAAVASAELPSERAATRAAHVDVRQPEFSRGGQVVAGPLGPGQRGDDDRVAGMAFPGEEVAGGRQAEALERPLVDAAVEHVEAAPVLNDVGGDDAHLLGPGAGRPDGIGLDFPLP